MYVAACYILVGLGPAENKVYNETLPETDVV
jgi:hypothetical protein